MLLPRHVSEILAVTKALKSFNVNQATRIQAQFDPFHHRVKSIRDFIFYTSAQRFRLTNSKCLFRTVIVDDRSDPELKVTLVNKDEIVFKTANLDCVEILRLFNLHVSDLRPKEEEPETAAAASKKLKKKRNYV